MGIFLVRLWTPLPIFLGKKSCSGDHFLWKTRKREREREKEKFSGKLPGSFVVGRRLLRLHRRWERASELVIAVQRRCAWKDLASPHLSGSRGGVLEGGSLRGGEGREGGGNCQDLVDRCSRWCRLLFSFIGSSSGSQAMTPPPPPCAMAAFTAFFSSLHWCF